MILHLSPLCYIPLWTIFKTKYFNISLIIFFKFKKIIVTFLKKHALYQIFRMIYSEFEFYVLFFLPSMTKSKYLAYFKQKKSQNRSTVISSFGANKIVWHGLKAANHLWTSGLLLVSLMIKKQVSALHLKRSLTAH